MGLGAGGSMKQKIYPDPYGIETWDQDNYGRIFIHIINSSEFFRDHWVRSAADAHRCEDLHRIRAALVRPL